MQAETKSTLIPFQFEDRSIRAASFDETVWFVARDIAAVLDYANPSRSIQDHCKNAKSLKDIAYTVSVEANEINGLPTNTLMIQEPDVFRLIVKSTKPESERFERFVFEEVLPSIRKTGSYGSKPMSVAELILQQAQVFVAYEKRMAEFDDRVKRIECKQQAFEDGIRYFTVIGYVGYKGLPVVNMSQAQKLGKLAKKLSSDRGVAVDRVKDQRHGYVGAYHESVLDDAYAQLLEDE
jgi:prophage antirepressor-like protein